MITEFTEVVAVQSESNEVLKEKLKAAADEIVKMEAENAENLAKAAADIATRERTIEMGQTFINALQDNISASREEITKLKSAEKKLQTKLGEEKAANKALKDDNTGLAEGFAAMTKSVKDLKKEKADAEEKISSQAKMMDELKKDLKNAMKVVTKLQAIEKELNNDLDEMTKSSVDIETVKAVAEEKMNKQMTQIDALKKDLN